MAVSPAVISSIDRRKRVRKRVRGTSTVGEGLREELDAGSDEEAKIIFSGRICSPSHAPCGNVRD